MIYTFKERLTNQIKHLSQFLKNFSLNIKIIHQGEQLKLLLVFYSFRFRFIFQVFPKMQHKKFASFNYTPNYLKWIYLEVYQLFRKNRYNIRKKN